MKMKKILLIIPKGGYFVLSFSQLKITMPTLGIGYISSYLKNKGYDVNIIDLNLKDLSNNELKALLADFKPQIAGTSFTTMGRFEAFDLIKLIKQALPETLTIAGGPHASLTTDDTLTHLP